ncbi:MAG: GH116 family glycosyl hydrolase [Armatimonadota bacterium]
MSRNRLFPHDTPNRQWSMFPADGFGTEVAGVVYRTGQADCGMPLGGIATGHIHLTTDCTLGWCTIFDSIIPPRDLGGVPLLAMAVGDKVWLLGSKKIDGCGTADEVFYWGHYPVADLDYEIDSPVDVCLRAWSPFLPGDAEGSNTPAVIFEVRLSNDSDCGQAGALAITFPGPSEGEIGEVGVWRKEVTTGSVGGVAVGVGEDVGYFLGAIGVDCPRTGGDLSVEQACWSRIADSLPSPDGPGASIAVDFDLAAGETKTVRFILSWYKPVLTVNGRHQYVHAYAHRFDSAVAVAEMIASEHESILRRILAWQEVIYSEKSFPPWLRDCLVNNFHMITKDSFWEANSIPPEDWARDFGMFSMVESIRTWPGQACIPSDWFGNLQIVYFFPALAHSTLRGFAHYQLPSGETPIYFGQNYERQNPVYQFLNLTSPCNYVDLVDRLWRRTGNDAILYEFYPSIKRAVDYLKSLDTDIDGIIDCQNGAICHQFYGAWNWYGASPHVAGMWLSALAMAERMADKIGDTSFVRDCQIWRKLGCQSLESKLWNGDYYMLYNDTTTGQKDDTILGNQLAGIWSCRLHGVEDVFAEDRVRKTLDTVKRVCFPAAKYGSATASRPDGSATHDGKHQSADIFLGECMVLAATMIYAGECEVGIEIARQLMEAIVLESGRAWDMPGFLDNDTGKPSYGNDFDQMMAVWSLPSAIAGQTLEEFASEGGFVDRIIRAAGAKS